MKQRGRQSVAAKTTPTPINSRQKVAPPDELTEDEAAEWVKIVAAVPAEWFSDDNLTLLVQYCRHIIRARRVAWMIDVLDARAAKMDEEEAAVRLAPSYDKYYKMAERESRTLASLATKMRLSQQSTYDKEKRKGARKNARKPWES